MQSPETHGAATTITGGTILTPFDQIAGGAVTFADGRITAVGPVDAAADNVATIDATGLYVAPGFIDLHTQGGCGHDIWMGTAEALEGWSRCQARHGVTSYMLTTGYATSGYDYLCTHLDLAATAAKPIGIYLESPFCSMEKRGGISPNRVGDLSVAKLDEIQATTGDALVMMTVAPERDGACEVIAALGAHGIIAAVGHTDCSYEQARAAFDAGATHVTHCFNAMRSLHHRDPGPLPAALSDDRVTVELILDGKHIHPAVIDFAVRKKGIDLACVVTDNIRAAGMSPAEHTFQRMEQTITVKDGVPRLPDGTIAGSTLTMDRALANVVAFTGLSLVDALRMLTATPAKAARIGERKGQLKVGHDADLVIFDEDFTVHRTIVGGRTVYTRSTETNRG